jgi:hypothetical protein
MSGQRQFLILSGLVLCLAGTAFAQQYAPRQYYSDWKKPAQGKYAYRQYYYKPTPSYAGYRVHEVRFFPQKPKHYYYYNTKTQKYWGRCPTEANGTPSYSLLKMEDRHKDLEMIPESAFPPPAKLPPIPESDPAEGAFLDLPPEDAPSFPAP